MIATRSNTLYLVSCVSRKLNRQAAAKDLYCSDWFMKARKYVEREGAQWRILSAEYGLVHPDTLTVPYERTLNTMGVAERRRWAGKVLAQLRPVLQEIDQVVILAGERYREFLIDGIRALVPKVEIPLRGLQIGKQLAWFKHELSQPRLRR